MDIPDLVVVGAGLFGLTVAETVARELGRSVLVVERRSHLGGNAWSEIDADTGIELPTDGYAAWLTRMVASPLITVQCGVDYFEVRTDLPPVPLVYTGPLDRYFGCRAGDLSWRTLDFEAEVLPVDDYQGTSVLNYADAEVPWTRVHEYRHLHPERRYATDRTIIARECSRRAEGADEPYYPVNAPRDRERLRCYRRLAAGEDDVWFGGRLGCYQYLDMHMAIASALRLVRNELAPRLGRAAA